ncbi:MAG: radical SAM protein, partial [Nanoarchaeota archaeon]|nr:radical SAM protein [Nanoarchaeota archaeon]
MQKVAQLELTPDCNHSCFYCYNPNDLKSQGKLSDNEWLDIVSSLSGFTQIILTGGEPFVRKDLVFEILGSNPNLPLSINSNLSLLNQEDLERLVKHSPFMLVSVPSINPETYKQITGKDNLERTLDNLGYLISNGLRITANMVVTPGTVSHVKPLGQKLKELGLKCLYATPVEGHISLSRDKTIEVFDTLLDLQDE